jgi:hypothetical protein
MLQKTDIVSYRLTNEELQLCCTNAKKAAINGYSHIRSKADRTLHLEQDQLIGQIGEYVGHMILFNSCDGYLKSRALANANPYQGDSGTDVIDQHVDFKTSRLSLRGLPISQHNLVVRPHEKHDNTTYILILVDSTMSRAYVVGYAHTSELPKDVNKTGIFQGAYVLPALSLNPITHLQRRNHNEREQKCF